MGDEADHSNQYYLALLVGKTRRTRERTRGVGSARLTLIGQQLTYAIHLSKVVSPTAVWFVEEHGTLLHEIGLTTRDMDTTGNSNTYKICGTWSDVPSIYTRYLETGKLHIVITTVGRPDGEISGLVRPHTAMQQETFSGLLAPSRRDGSGALVIMTYQHTGSLSFVVLHSGVAERKCSLNVTLIFSRKKRSIAQFAVTLEPQETEVSGVWLEPASSYMKSLVRGRLHFVLVRNRRSILHGDVVPRLTCNVLHAVLTTNEESSSTTDRQQTRRDHNRPDDKTTRPKSSRRRFRPGPSRPGAGAVVTLTVTEKGKLDYKVNTGSLDTDITAMTIREQLRPSTRHICSVTARILPGSGSCGSIQARHIESLYRGELEVSLHTGSDPSPALTGPVHTGSDPSPALTGPVHTGSDSPPALTGPVHEVVYHHDSFHSGVDLVLTGSEMNPPVSTRLVAHAWLSVSPLCALHFTVVIQGFSSGADSAWTPYVKDRLDGHSYVSTLFNGNMAQGYIADLPAELFARLSVGLVVFGISTTRHPSGEILSNVTLDSSCGEPMRREEARDETPLHDEVLHEDIANLPQHEHVVAVNQCTRNGIVYSDGETWIPVDAPCSTCGCVRGDTQCQRVICPHAACEHPIDIRGDCCPHCPPSGSSADYQMSEDECYFSGDKRMHRHGTVFHPYVKPFGYQRCAVCSCASGNDEVVCAQLPCPNLPCDARVAVRMNPGDCCKQCPDGATLQDEQPLDDTPFTDILNMQTACSYRGKTYADGSEWHPQLASFTSHESCVKCTCTAGKSSCAREVCAALECSRELQVKRAEQCCARCVGS